MTDPRQELLDLYAKVERLENLVEIYENCLAWYSDENHLPGPAISGSGAQYWAEGDNTNKAKEALEEGAKLNGEGQWAPEEADKIAEEKNDDAT